MADTVINMENVTVNFGGFKALNRVNFFVERGELRFLIGPNGAGKTTLLDVICGKIKPEKGQVIFNNRIDVCRLNEHEIAREGISRKFQTPSIFPNHTVFENMELSLKSARGIFSSLIHPLNGSDMDKIFHVLDIVGLKAKAYQKAGFLSHGEKQWLELAMTILQEPVLLLVDEPVAGMTGTERNRTGMILTEIAKERPVLVVEHDMNFVKRFAEKVTVLHEGRVLCEGTFDHIKNDPVVIDVYLGRGGEVEKNAFA